MLLLKLTLVILILEIGERTMCSGPCPTAAESSPLDLPPGSLLDTPDNKKCNYKVLADLDAMEVLIVNCTKTCTNGKHRTVTNGQTCINKFWVSTSATAQSGPASTAPKEITQPKVTETESTELNEVTVLVGTCQNGSCVAPDNTNCRTITLPEEADDDEGDEEEEEDEEEDEEEEEEDEEEED
uniref:Putative secreted salivary gland peptide n=1 Tax=Ixodes ricinus TaxID=34613 RepID=A0A090XE77_IXORI